ncbi:MAG: deoxyhypusine synthase family protein [Deltaproteobacteria bacterium]|nr:deoxyhypusine synthase family protein [Deltaproteobacteria bacterium]
MSEQKCISLKNVKTYPLKDRSSKVKKDDFAKTWKSGGDMTGWLNSLPDILAARDIKKIVDNIVRAAKSRKMIILAMGAHVIKVGLNPIIIDLMERGIIKCLALNGAGIIHDFELALAGHTSEDVSARLGDGSFGMAEETGSFLNEAIIRGAAKGYGLGKSVGEMLVEKDCPFRDISILSRAYNLDIPVTVHVAIGTDIIHFHPKADGASIGKTSHFDFRIFAECVANLEEGVFINLGSAVILPEVFLKAVTLVRNLGHDIKRFTTINMDFIQSYRPMTNVVSRPTLEGGEGYSLTGHHEIMFPLLAAAVIERLESE